MMCTVCNRKMKKTESGFVCINCSQRRYNLQEYRSPNEIIRDFEKYMGVTNDLPKL